jgi:hypothetical protein
MILEKEAAIELFKNFSGKAENLKICFCCKQIVHADKNFCPFCGKALPTLSLAESAVCDKCGKQNAVGEVFCGDCGTKLPLAVQLEEAAKMRDEDALKNWEILLPHYPKWTCGGHDFCLVENGINEDGRPYYRLEIKDANSSNLIAYREILKQSGFCAAGKYPTEDSLYKRIGGIVYCFDSSDAYMGESGTLSLTFGIFEPCGGFDYVEPKKGRK